MFSRRLALEYFRWALRLCRWTCTPPSLLLHPLDFLGCDEVRELAFFPAMSLPAAAKVALVGEVVDRLAEQFHVVPLREHAAAARSAGLAARAPRFRFAQ